MPRQAPALFLALPLLLAGCGHPWPQAAKGGLAERDPVRDETLARIGSAIAQDEYAGAPRPAATSIARENWAMAVRETEAGLYEDAAASELAASVSLGGIDAVTEGLVPTCLKAPCN